MSSIIEIVMLSAAAIILIVTQTDGIKATQGSVFPAGMQAVIAIFGIAWMGDTFLQGNMAQLTLLHRRNRPADAVVVRYRPVRDVHPAI